MMYNYVMERNIKEKLNESTTFARYQRLYKNFFENGTQANELAEILSYLNADSCPIEIPENDSAQHIQVGDRIYILGQIASSSCKLLFKYHRNLLEQIFSEFFLRNTEIAIKPESDLNNPYSEIDLSTVRSITPLGEKGLYGALLKMAENRSAGFRIDINRIPLCQEFNEIFEHLEINPYSALSSGCYIITADKNYKGPGLYIGCITDDHKKSINIRSESSLLNRPGQDEYLKFLKTTL